MINGMRDKIINENINDNQNLYIKKNQPIPIFSSPIKKESTKFQQTKKKR